MEKKSSETDTSNCKFINHAAMREVWEIKQKVHRYVRPYGG